MYTDYKIEYIEYRHSSSVMQGCFSVSAARQKGKAILLFSAAGQKPRKFKPGDGFFPSLEEICRKHDIARWHNFKESGPSCLDGESCGLSVLYCGFRQSTSFQCNGPEGFADFMDDFRNLCSPYFAL